jgi:hypothetical protein
MMRHAISPRLAIRSLVKGFEDGGDPSAGVADVLPCDIKVREYNNVPDVLHDNEMCIFTSLRLFHMEIY